MAKAGGACAEGAPPAAGGDPAVAGGSLVEGASHGAGGDLAVVGGTVHTAHGVIIPSGTVLILKGRIARVGPASEVPVPEGVAVIQAGGRTVIPGLVELWSDLSSGPPEGSPGGAAHHRVADLLEPFPRPWRRALAEGVTTVGVAPSPVRGVGGLGTVLKLRARVGEPFDLAIRRDSHLVLALGTTPPGIGPPRISTAERLEQYYSLRQRLVAARDYRKGWNSYWEAVEKYNQELSGKAVPLVETPEARSPEEKKPEDKKPEEKKPEEKKAEPKKPRPPEKPRLDLEKEVLRRAMEGKLPVLVVAHQKADIGYALRLKEEFGLDLAVMGATEGHRSAAGARVAVGPALLSSFSLQLLDHRESNAAELVEAAVPVALSGLGGAAFPSSALRLEACVAVRGGLQAEAALRAITAEPAAILGLSDRLGTIEAGKDGDLAILDGEPLSALTRVMNVIVEGRVAYQREAEL